MRTILASDNDLESFQAMSQDRKTQTESRSRSKLRRKIWGSPKQLGFGGQSIRDKGVAQSVMDLQRGLPRLYPSLWLSNDLQICGVKPHKAGESTTGK